MCKQPRPANYAELIAGIRKGNPYAVINFRDTFTSGIKFFLTRDLNEIDVADRVEEVVTSVIQEIAKGCIAGPSLTSQILESIRRNIGPRKLSRQSAEHDLRHQPVTDGSRLAVDMLKSIPEREREALKRYYVDLKAENDICTELNLTVAQFHDCKLRFRTQFMNTWGRERDTGGPIEMRRT